MASELTLPGDIPGLLRKCSPVLVRFCEKTLKGVCTLTLGDDGDPWAYAAPSHSYEEWQLSAPFDCRRMTLDLTDATGRAHAAWWLGGRCQPVHQWFHLHYAMGMWTDIHWSEGDREVFWTAMDTWREHSRTIRKLLDGLHHWDPRTIEDGSRWVDAEALRRVVLHVAGGNA